MGKWRVYKDTSGEWRSSYTSTNGNILMVSAEGYKNKEDCVAAITTVLGSTDDPVEIEGEETA